MSMATRLQPEKWRAHIISIELHGLSGTVIFHILCRRNFLFYVFTRDLDCKIDNAYFIYTMRPKYQYKVITM